ncbi:plasmid mobilization protein [Lysobacter capsici AZ78]|uniref:Plasmid mobilization protein n=2 Tax=Lysobacter capsici TaxID=435897 RepID=A0A108U8C9_9GAMM|nr:plasmid mobilization protein [Lysobacter capsici AZ78]
MRQGSAPNPRRRATAPDARPSRVVAERLESPCEAGLSRHKGIIPTSERLMAIYHADIKTFSRAKGHSAVAAAAYRAGLHLVDAKGEHHNYKRRGGVENTVCFAPKGSPEWAIKPEELWVRASAAEKRCDATLCREFEAALPHQLDAVQRSALVGDICGQLIDRYSFAVQASIHSPRTQRGLNWHVHILATTRRMTREGLGEKTRELDGGPSGRAEVNWVREMLANRINAHLAQAGISARVDHRTLEAQSQSAEERGDFAAAMLLAREPTKHLGKSAAALDRGGLASARGAENEMIRVENNGDLQARLEAIQKEGRLMSTPDGHTQEAARRERQEAKQSARLDLSSEQLVAAGLARPRVRRTRSAPVVIGSQRVSLQRVGKGKSARESEIELLLFEAMRRWLEGIDETVRKSNWAIELFLVQREELIRQHGHRVALHRDCRELVRAIRQFSRDQSQWPRSLEAADRAQMELDQARLELGQLDPKIARAALWTKREWAQRRRAQEQRVAERQRARDEARDATGPEAQVRYTREVDRSLVELKRIADRMSKSYSIKEVEPITPKVSKAEEALDDQRHAKGHQAPRRLRSTLH